MKPETAIRLAPILLLTFAAGAAAQSMSAMRWHRRVLLVAAPTASDARVTSQRRIFSEWSREAADRDVTPVEINGSRVSGATDTATELRRRYHLGPSVFQVLLIGKDGHVALRSSKPVSAAILQSRIDAMPMRRAGER